MEYLDFIASKHKRPAEYGFDVDPSTLNPNMKDFQRTIDTWAIKRGRAALFCGTGLGKAQRWDQRILTTYGWVNISDAVVGMMVYGSDGKHHAITGVYPQGVRELAEVKFSDGTSTVCDWDHLWSVKTRKDRSRGNPNRVLTTRQMADHGLCDSGGSRFFVPLPSPIDFGSESREHMIDPYTLGFLIGDGSMVQGTCSVTNPDIDAVMGLSLPAGCEMRQSMNAGSGRCPMFYVNGGKYSNSANPFTDELKRLGLFGKRSENKFIPDEYKYGSIATRHAFIQGLLDTDGTTSGPCVEFTTASESLSNDVVFMVRSLGGTATQSRETAHYTKDGTRCECLDKFRSIVKLPSNFAPFRIIAKASRYNPIQRKEPYKTIKSIAPCEPDEAFCISVDAKDCLYITEGMTLTHNTVMQLVWGEQVVRHANMPVLLFCPLGVRAQTIAEAIKFSIGVHVRVAMSQDDVADNGIYVANFERLDKFDPSKFAGVIIDESGILKGLTGRIRLEMTRMFADTRFKLCCTATPAPNDHLELGNHAEFLGVCTRTEMMSKYFINDSGDTSKWVLKGHAHEAFWEWVSTWAICVSKPSDIGGSDEGYILPPLTIERHVVEAAMADSADGMLFNTSGLSATNIHEEKRLTCEARINKAADLHGDGEGPCLIWCDTNYESDQILKTIPGAVDVRGSHSAEEKERRLLDFANGKIDTMVSKPKIAGMGMNFQVCNRMIFAGLSYSFEAYFQSVRRCWRFGQTSPVRVDIILADSESAISSAIARKESDFELMQDGMAKAMQKATLAELEGDRVRSQFKATNPMVLPSFIQQESVHA